MCLVLMPGRTRAVSLREEYGFKLPLMTGTKQDCFGAVRPTQRAAGEALLRMFREGPEGFKGGFRLRNTALSLELRQRPRATSQI
jgi:hypothetical protein